MSDSVQKRIMIVEDDSAMRELLSEILGSGGYECQPVESGLRALSLQVLRLHPRLGWDLIHTFPQLGEAPDIVLHHHERWDGKGYSDGLAGLEIPLSARIFSVIDTLDAMLSDRPYRKAATLPEARAELAAVEGAQFDPEIVAAFSQLSDSEIVAIGRRHPDHLEEPGRKA